MRRIFFLIVLSVMGAFGPSAALAGPVESPAELAFHPTDSQQWVARWDFAGGGLLFSSDAGSSWSLVCNSAISPMLTGETDGLAITPSGDVFTGDFSGLWRVTNGGCGHSKVPELDGRWVSDVRNDPEDPNLIYAVTSNGGMDPDTGAAYQNGIFRFDAASDTWSELGSRDAFLISRLRVTKTDTGRRFYQSIAELGGAPDYISTLFVRYSDDGGDTWVSHSAFNDGEAQTEVRVEAIDPTDPNRIAVTQRNLFDSEALDKVWVNTAGGAPDAWVLVGEVAELGGVTFAPDGRMWFGDNLGSVYLVPPGSTTAEALGTEPIRSRCLQYDPIADAPLACRLTDVVAVASDGSVSPKLDFKSDVSWMTCPDVDMPSACQDQLAGLNWCNITHYPEAKICAEYCYPGLNNDAVADPGTACPAGTITPETVDEPIVIVDPPPAVPPVVPPGTVVPPTAGGPPTAVPPSGQPAMPNPSSEAEGSGCGCRLAGNHSEPSGLRPWGAGLLALALLARRRRRRS